MKKTILLLLGLCLSLMLQAAVLKTIDVSSAGTLYTLLTATEKTTVTDLTVTGTLDARDFVCLRDSMPVLSRLDLSAVYIDAYTGTAGTQVPGTYTYAAGGIPQKAFYFKSSLSSLIFPASVTSIGSNAFMYCTGLSGVISIPSGVSSMGNDAFSGCAGLTGNLVIPSSMTSLPVDAFWGCSGLTSVTIPSSITSIGNDAFCNCSGLTGVLNIPSSVTSIGEGVFAYCSKLTSVSLPPAITSIGLSTFIYCSGLTSIDIPASVTSIGASAFRYCTGLTSVVIPPKVTTLEYWIFGDCTGLKSVSIPSSVTSAQCYVFSGCSGLTSIYAYASTPADLTAAYNAFASVNTGTCTLYVPTNSVSAYQAATLWKDFTNIVGNLATSVNNALASQVKISVQHGQAIVTGVPIGDALSVYNLQGTPIYSGKTDETTTAVNLPAHGAYVVHVVTKSFKVVY